MKSLLFLIFSSTFDLDLCAYQLSYSSDPDFKILVIRVLFVLKYFQELLLRILNVISLIIILNKDGISMSKFNFKLHMFQIKLNDCPWVVFHFKELYRPYDLKQFFSDFDEIFHFLFRLHVFKTYM